MSIIDLGCGWGSVSIYLASKFPKCKITSVSNSHSQKVFILARAAERGYKNISVYTGKQIFNLFNKFNLKCFLSSFICHGICLVSNDIYRYQHAESQTIERVRAEFKNSDRNEMCSIFCSVEGPSIRISN